MIKVIENMKPWEVMKAHEEGKRVAIRTKDEHFTDPWEVIDKPRWNWQVRDYAIINDSQPELTAEWWGGFDWEFFNQWGGLPASHPQDEGYLINGCLVGIPAADRDCLLRESPFYPWSGGECPVPDNVEVELTFRQAFAPHGTYLAGDKELSWEHEQVGSDIIAFHLTGRVL